MLKFSIFRLMIFEYVYFKENVSYSGTSNSGHSRGPSLVVVALEVTVVGRFYYMYIFY